jgi:UDP-N-acetylglucosamine 3-dehydrogenase
MLKVGIVGCGNRGTGHAAKLKAIAGVELVGVCDLIRERADALAAAHGVRAVYDVRQLLDGVEVIWDATRPWERCEVVTVCAAAGKHVFSEKPIALDLPTADRYIAAIEKAGVMNAFCYPLHFWHPYRLAQALFARGDLGRLVNVWTRRYRAVDMRPTWYGDQALSGGVTVDFQTHDLDMLLWFGGPPEAVFAHMDRIREGVRADEHSQVMVRFAEGMGCSDCSWAAQVTSSSFGVVGTRGCLLADPSGQVHIQLDGRELLDLAPGVAPDLGLEISEETCEQHFVRCVLEGREPLVTPYRARAALRLALAAQESARQGASVCLAGG